LLNIDPSGNLVISIVTLILNFCLTAWLRSGCSVVHINTDLPQDWSGKHIKWHIRHKRLRSIWT
jgi:hypothetical protein